MLPHHDVLTKSPVLGFLPRSFMCRQGDVSIRWKPPGHLFRCLSPSAHKPARTITPGPLLQSPQGCAPRRLPDPARLLACGPENTPPAPVGSPWGRRAASGGDRPGPGGLWTVCGPYGPGSAGSARSHRGTTEASQRFSQTPEVGGHATPPRPRGRVRTQ